MIELKDIGSEIDILYAVNALNAAVRELQAIVEDMLKETGMEHLPHPRTGNLKSSS